MNGAAELDENPLVPTRALQAMRAVMLRLRAMEPKAAERRRGKASLRGGEAVRAASLVSLREGDLVSDVRGGLSGEQVASLWSTGAGSVGSPRVVSLDANEPMRLLAAMGAGAALQARRRRGLLLLYAVPESRSRVGWGEVLGLAGRSGLPVIVCVLPGAGGVPAGELSARSQRFGVPGIPVDAADAVALYRVMQECVQRVRAGGGPALLEAVAWTGPAAGRGKVDAVAMLDKVLRARGGGSEVG